MSEVTDLETKTVELIEKFETLATNIAPDAIDLGLAAARIAAAEEVLSLVLYLSLLVGSIFTIKYHAPKATWENEWFHETMTLLGGFGVTWFSLFSVISLSIWPFVGIVHPELWIAKQVLGW